MNHKITNYDDIINVVSLAWELWQSNLQELEEIFKPLIEDNKWLVINLWEVDYVNSMTIWFLINVIKSKKNTTIGTISSNVADIFSELWIYSIAQIHGSEEVAINSLIEK